MGLDFLQLTREIAGNASQTAPEGLETPERINTLQEENPPEGAKNGLLKLQREADIEARERERAGAVYKEYQQNKAISSQLQSEILKGTRAGESIEELYLKAVKAISLLTHNELFYRQIATELEQR